MFLTSKEFTSIVTEKEKWFGTEYKQDYLPEELIKKCETCDVIPELHLPTPNEFIPTDFQLFSKKTNVTRPEIPTKIKVKQSRISPLTIKSFLFKENEFYRLFHAEDSFYKLPKAYLYFEFRK